MHSVSRTFEFSGWGKKDEWTRVKPSVFLGSSTNNIKKRVENSRCWTLLQVAAVGMLWDPALMMSTSMWYVFFYDLSCFFSCVRCEWHLNLLIIWYDLFISVLRQWLAQGDRKSDWWSWKEWEDWEQTERPRLKIDRSDRSDGSDRSTIMTCLCRESKNKKKKKRNKRKEWQSKEKDDASGSAGSGSEGGIVWQILSLVHLRWGGEE